MPELKTKNSEKWSWKSSFTRLADAFGGLFKKKDEIEKASEIEIGLSESWKKLSTLPVEFSTDDIMDDTADHFEQQHRVNIGDLGVVFRNWDKSDQRIRQVNGIAKGSREYPDQFSFDGDPSHRMDLGGKFLPDELRKDGVTSVILDSKGSHAFFDSEITSENSVNYMSVNGRIEQIEFVPKLDANREGVIVYKLVNGAWIKEEPKRDFGLETKVMGTNDHDFVSFRVGDSEILALPPINEKQILEKGTKLVDEIVAGYTKLTSINDMGGYGGQNAQEINETGNYPDTSSKENAAADFPIGPMEDLTSEQGRSYGDPRWPSDKIGPTE